MAIDAYEIAADGTHMPVESRDRSSGTATQESAPASSGTDLHAADVPPGSAPAQDTPPQSPGMAAPGEGEASDDDDEPMPETATMDYVQRAINRQTRRYRSLERAREADRVAAEQRFAQQQAHIETLTRLLQGAAPDLPPAAPSGPPQAEQFTTHEAYVRATGRYEAQQLLAERDQQARDAQQRTQQEAFQQELVAREQAFKEAHPDFDAVVRAGLVGKVSAPLQQALMLLPDGPALAYMLARQRDVVQRLNTLHPALMVAELGRLLPQAAPAATGDTPPPTSPSTGTRPPPLPEPLRPVGGGGTPAPPGYRDDASQEDYRAWRARTSQLPRWKQTG